jgi:hypothetical protein
MLASERMIPATRRRVRRNTDEAINRRIDRQRARSILYFSAHPEQIAERLDELDYEWDIERIIEANAATLVLAGTAIGVASKRKMLALPLLVGGFLLQHAVQGWCPPVPILRRLGFRTADEINAERYALKALRGDFNAVASGNLAKSTAAAAFRATN